MLLDVQMPGMDGFETAELIKGRERTRDAADHLRDRDQQGAPPRLPRLLGGRGGLRLQALRPGDPALEGRGVPRARREVARGGAQRGDPARGVRRRADRDGAAGPRGARSTRPTARSRRCSASGPPTCATGCSTTSCTATTLAARPRAADAGATAFEHEARLVAPRRRGDPVPAELLARAAGRRRARRDRRAGAGPARAPARARRSARSGVREQAARAEAERTSERLRAVQRISDAALGHAGVRRARARAAQPDRRGARRPTPPRSLLHEADGDDGRSTRPPARASAAARRRASERVPTTPATDGGIRLELAARRRGGVDAGGAAGRRRRRRSARCTSARCSRARSPTTTAALLRLAADRAAIGIQRARLFQREHRIAEELQRSLLPGAAARSCRASRPRRATSPPAPARRSAATGTTRVIQPDGRLLLIVGDVAGRGHRPPRRRWASCAARCAPTRSTGTRPASLLERLNAFQVGLRNARHDDDRRWSRVDPATGELRYAKAGPPAGADRRRRRAARRGCDDAAGLPLGALDDPVFTEGTATLDAGLDARALQRRAGRAARRAAGPRASSGWRRRPIAAPDDIDALCDAIARAARWPTPPPRTTSRCWSCAWRRARRRRGRRSVPAPAHRPAAPASCAAAPGRTRALRSAAVELPGGLAGQRGRARRRRRHAGQRRLQARARRPADRRHRARQQRGRPRRRRRTPASACVVHVAAADERLRAEVSSRGAGVRACARRRRPRSRAASGSCSSTSSPAAGASTAATTSASGSRSIVRSPSHLRHHLRSFRCRWKRRHYGPPGSTHPRARTGA